MSLALDHIAARDLARALLERIFATFTGGDASSLALLNGDRRRIKPSAIVESGFRISEWHEHREGFRDHGGLLTPSCSPTADVRIPPPPCGI